MSEPVNSVTMKVLQPLWNQSSPRTNNCLAYSNYAYSGIGPKKHALSNQCILPELVFENVTLADSPSTLLKQVTDSNLIWSGE